MSGVTHNSTAFVGCDNYKVSFIELFTAAIKVFD
jgi:hypothetical protein